MDIDIDVDLNSAVPAYEQIRIQVTELVESGRLPIGYGLPSVRQLAADLRVAPGTIARGYKELETRGLVTCNRWDGTRVAGASRLRSVERRRRLDEVVARLVGAAHRLGVPDEEITAAVTRALDRSSRGIP